MQLEAGNKVGSYKVVRRLGQGGMSNVYLANDEKNDREVVLKFPHEELLGDVSSHERFNREVKIGKLLDSDHIQKLYELADEKGSPYLVLEYVPGEPMRYMLREKAHKHSPADFETVVDLGTQIGNALGHAHSHNVAHRDLKPENIIITPDGVAKVMDFGIALLRGARRVTWGPMSSQVGTPDYMAPEQIQGARGDARTDVYALGMILFEYLAGKLPYEGDNPLSVMNQHVTVKAPPIHKFRRDVPHQLEEIILKAIRRNPQDRWATMDDFVKALKEWKTADVEALTTERENETDNAKLGKLAGQARIPALPATIGTVLVIAGIFAALLVAAHFGHHAR
jgi:serine/threonine-protein kinase